jgi:hypothetical protein
MVGLSHGRDRHLAHRQLLFKQHGIRAAFFAIQRADELLVSGDDTGCSIWIRISRAIGDLGRQKPRDDEAVN